MSDASTKGSSQQQPEAASVAPVWKVDDLVWCYRCKRIESVGAVLHDGPYTLENSRLVTLAANRDPGMESVRGAVAARNEASRTKQAEDQSGACEKRPSPPEDS